VTSEIRHGLLYIVYRTPWIRRRKKAEEETTAAINMPWGLITGIVGVGLFMIHVTSLRCMRYRSVLRS